jgi:hypothetical protein
VNRAVADFCGSAVPHRKPGPHKANQQAVKPRSIMIFSVAKSVASISRARRALAVRRVRCVAGVLNRGIRGRKCTGGKLIVISNWIVLVVRDAAHVPRHLSIEYCGLT